MATIRFYLKPLKNGEAQIMAAFQNGDKCPTKYLGYTIPSSKSGKDYRYWNKKESRVRTIDKAHEINKKINDWENAFNGYISDCNLNDEAPNIDWFKNQLEGTFLSQQKVSKKKPTLSSILQPFLDSMKGTHHEKTINKYKVVVTNLREYQASSGHEVLLSEVDSSFYKAFANNLIKTENNFNRIVNRKQKQIVTIINFAINDLKIPVPGNDYTKRYVLKEAPAAKFPLLPEELAALYTHKPADPFHQMLLDAFILSCETGLRYSDIEQLRPGHIRSHVVGEQIIYLIDLVNVKGSDGNNMPLSQRAQAIIDTYSKDDNTPLFKFEPGRPASRHLKIIFAHKDLNLNRPCEVVQMQGAKTDREILPLHDVINFHMARNTYITRLLSSGISPSFVQQNAGHSKLDITMGYFRGDDVTRWQETLRILNPEPNKKSQP